MRKRKKIDDLILLAIGIMPGVVNSQNIKLLCDVEIAELYTVGHMKRSNSREILQVTDSGGYKKISSQSNVFAAISTDWQSENVEINDFSNANKWDIRNKYTLINGTILDARITIDRNSARLSYTSFYSTVDKGSVAISASGSCEKVDESIRKF